MILPLRAALTALLVTLAAPSDAADRALRLRVPPEVVRGVAAMPKIRDPADDAGRRINAALGRLDASVRKAAGACRAEGGAHSSWERSVVAPMRGPRFLALAITDSSFCGGAHPNVGTMAIVYDLTTGAPIDWTALLPASLTGTVALDTGADGTRMVTLASRRLHALYLAAYRPRAGTSGSGEKSESDQRSRSDGDEEACREAVTNTSGERPPAMMAWPDAKAGGLAVQFDLPHAVQACADIVVIPTATLRQDGASSVLTDAIDAAHARRPAP